jgi:Fic family protein
MMKVLQQLDELKVKLDAIRPLSAASVESLMNALQVELVYTSNAIEGNSLTLRETQLVLEQGITIGGKKLKDHLEAVNLRDAWLVVLQKVTSLSPVTEAEILDLHRIVLGGSDAHAGHYRTMPVFISGARHVPPNAMRVPEKMAALCAAAAESKHAALVAAQLHHGISHIHPFVDGNGRTARLIMNLCLMRHGWPPVRIQPEERLAYYDALAAADGGDDSPFALWLAGHLVAELEYWLAVLK